MSDVVTCAGADITKQVAIPEAKGPEYLPKSPAVLFIWASWRCLPTWSVPTRKWQTNDLPWAVPDALN